VTKAEINAFKTKFKLTSTGESADVGKSDIKRKMLAHYIRKSGDEAFEMLGYKQESLTVGSNYDASTLTDVTGATHNDINGKAESIEMSEYKINPVKTKFLEEAIKLKALDLEEDMHDYEILTVYGYLRDDKNNCMATLETGCTVVLDNHGGSGFTHNDVNITLSGIKTFGTVPEIVAVHEFTEYTPAKAE
jgi:hypothetical protein